MPRHSPPPPDPRDVRFVPKLDHPPLDPPRVPPPDRIAARRARAEHLCLWLGCSRVLCRNSRRCHGPGAPCVFEQAAVRTPLLEEIAGAR
jgi:hypothetical protein